MAQPYDKAKNWRDTQADIAKLFQKHGIKDVQWTIREEQRKAALVFSKRFIGKRSWDSVLKQLVETEPDKEVVVRLYIPMGHEGPERNRAFRVLYWYLKSKLESIAFKFQDGTELFSFEREFFGHVLIRNAMGEGQTAFDAFKDASVSLEPAAKVIALPGGR